MRTSDILILEIAGAAACAAVFAVRAFFFVRGLARSACADHEARAETLRRYRLGSALATGAQFVFLASLIYTATSARVHVFGWALGYFLSLILAQSQVNHAVNRAVRGTEATHFEFLKYSLRTLGGTLALYAGYYVVTFTVGGGLSRIGGFEHFGMPLGVLLGLMFIGMASPFFVRLMMPCSRVRDPKVVEILERCFRRAALPIPSFWMIEIDRFKAHNAMVAGFRWGRGPFRPALFFTRSLLETMPPAEFEAVMFHEVSHVALHHVRKRLLAGFAAYLVTIAPYILFVPRLSESSEVFLPILFATLAVSIVAQIFAVKWVVRLQELEADRNALKLGADLEALCGALQRITQMNDQSTKKKDPTTLLNASAGHPAAGERIRLLRAPEEKGHARWILRPALIAFGSAIFVSALTLSAARVASTPGPGSERSVAGSVTDDATFANGAPCKATKKFVEGRLVEYYTRACVHLPLTSQIQINLDPYREAIARCTVKNQAGELVGYVPDCIDKVWKKPSVGISTFYTQHPELFPQQQPQQQPQGQ